MTNFEAIAKAVCETEDALKETFDVEIAYRETNTQKLVLLHFDGEKFVKSSGDDRLRYLGVQDQSSVSAICEGLGIYMYPVKGHCHEEQILAQNKPDAIGKYFVATDVGGVLDSVMDNVEASVVLYDSSETGYEAVYSELLQKEYI